MQDKILLCLEEGDFFFFLSTEILQRTTGTKTEEPGGDAQAASGMRRQRRQTENLVEKPAAK